VKQSALNSSHFHIRMAVHTMRYGGVIAYPTEAVYGLGCDPRNETAVHHLLELKQRPVSKGLILIAADFSQLQRYVIEPPPTRKSKLDQSWPGPVTWLIPARPETPRWLTGVHHTLAVRVTAHPLAATLCRIFGGPIVSTSANLAGYPPARTPLAVRRYFHRQLGHIIHDKTGSNRNPTEIRNLADGSLLRPA